ncbi:MAG: CDP-alcohol phosphatidyltransferase family protein [Saprospiraceae bacterium]|nr:CDP-alcohol phosphatidyltransferase family protein [Saprospiraceae bacterium]MBK8850980.1 CDP-alcohol phosphatidyltransferase family protein [Saprospiraceae bacterium]MBK9689384.1 CDP-alcohol phosphatidyltransferase family protein [Saprospiraceae bacterium]MBL0081436.1 CDP-alcohol phosphatidyltransferase family protein [Saprospiraceae bacterium]
MENNWKNKGQQWVYSVINPFINLLIKLGITPNFITFLGLIINILASIIFIVGVEKGSRGDHRYIGWAAATILLGGLMDMIDGRLARVGKQESRYGAIFDSVLDRYSEMIMFLGICYYLIGHSYFLSSLFAFIGMIGSIMVSYTRARAEGMGLKMSDIGFMQRPERILLIGISGLACGVASHFIGSDYKIIVDWLPFPLFETITIFTFPLFILAILANITAINRLLAARDLLNQS